MDVRIQKILTVLAVTVLAPLAAMTTGEFDAQASCLQCSGLPAHRKVGAYYELVQHARTDALRPRTILWASDQGRPQAYPPLVATLEAPYRSALESLAPWTLDRLNRRVPLVIDDIVNMHAARIPERVILDQIANTSTYFVLTEQDRRELLLWGLSPYLINYLSTGQE